MLLIEEIRRSPADMENIKISRSLQDFIQQYGSQQLCSFHVLTHFFAWILVDTSDETEKMIP